MYSLLALEIKSHPQGLHPLEHNSRPKVSVQLYGTTACYQYLFFTVIFMCSECEANCCI